MSDGGTKHQNICIYCNELFESRNRLFRHIRTNPDCTERFIIDGGKKAKDSLNNSAPRHGLILLFGYYRQHFTTHDSDNDDSAEDRIREMSESKEACKILVEAFAAVHINVGYSDLKISQASEAEQRPKALSQEKNCIAAGDVITLRYRSNLSFDDNTQDLVEKMNHQIKMNGGGGTYTSRYGLHVRVLSAEKIVSEINVEQDTTQVAYHYLVPLAWLPDSESAIKWWLEEKANHECSYDENTNATRRGFKRYGNCDNKQAHTIPCPKSFKGWKKALQTAVSTNNNDKSLQKERSGGKARFRGLRQKAPRCWHNFADPFLLGDASPNKRPVWRVLDRAQTVDFQYFYQSNNCNNTNDENTNVRPGDDVFMVVELRGDGFVTQQVRRIIGSAIAICHGWLPPNFINIATMPQVVVETPLAPENLMFLAGVRYDFNEIARDDAMFSSFCSNDQRLWISDVRNSLLLDLDKSEVIHGWLKTLRDEISPRIRAQLQKLEADESMRKKGIKAEPAGVIAHLQNDRRPHIYDKTLCLLREIVKKNEWPATSSARSKVIRSFSSSSVQKQQQSGSFTVVNPNCNLVGHDAMLGNALFPELASAVFSLEEKIVSLHRLSRDISSHCAINSNAEFTPHVDSGKGAGQSVSLIVGLGTYSGGNLVVEGKSYNVAYQPVEFDGWKMRHWTEPFEGERYSLVWFTPE